MSLNINPLGHLWSFVQLLGAGLQSAASQVRKSPTTASEYLLETNAKTAKRAQDILSPWMDAAGASLHTVLRRQVIAMPPQLHVLMEAIKKYLSKTTAGNFERLANIAKKLPSQSNAIKREFPALDAEAIQKLRELPDALNACQDVPTVLLKNTRTLLTDIRDICVNYDMINQGRTVCQILVDDFNKQINSTVDPLVRQTLAALKKLLGLNHNASQRQWRDACTRIILRLDALHRNCSRLNIGQMEGLRELRTFLHEHKNDEERHTEILKKVRKARTSLQRVFDADHGLVQKTGESLKGVLHELASELVRVFRQTMGQVMSDGTQILQGAMSGQDALPRLPSFDANSFRTSRRTAASSRAEEEAPSQRTFGGLMPLLKNVQHFFSEQALSGLSTALQYSLKFLKNHLQCNIPQTTRLIKQTIDTSIQSLEEAQTSEEIIDAVKQCFNVLSSYEVYVQHVRLPMKNSERPSVAPNLLKLARSLEEQKDEPEITRDKVDEMATRFEYRASSFIAFKIAGKVCGITLNGSESAQLLDRKAHMPLASYPKALRARFFAFLDKSSANFLAKWSAKCLYIITCDFAHLFIHSAVESIKVDFAAWQKKDTSAKGKDIIRFGRHVFSVISGIYTSVSETPSEREKDIFTLLNEAVKAPCRNGGLPPDKFYAAIVTTAMKFVRFNWTLKIEGFFNRPLIAPTSPIAFCTPFVNLLGAFCKKGLQAIVYIPQNICSFVLQKTTSLIIKKTVKPHTLIDTYIDQVRDPRTSTSFELHKWVEFKLRKITERVREDFDDTGDKPELMPTSDQQLEIVTCLKSVIEVLQKSRKYTVDELRQYARSDRTVLERMQREVQEYILPEARLPISRAIYTALEEALTEQSLLEVQYSLLNIGNGIFDEQVPVTESEFRAVDKGIEDVADELLDEIIKTILKEKLDLNNAFQQKEISKFTGKFKQKTEKFVQDFDEYQAILADEDADYDKKAQALKDLNALTRQFIYQEVDAHGAVGSNRHLHQGTKSQLNETMHGLQLQLEPIAAILIEMQELDEAIAIDRRTEEAFLGVRESLGNLEVYYANPETNQMFECQLEQLDAYIEHLQSVDIPHLAPLIKAHGVLNRKQARIQVLKKATETLDLIKIQWGNFFTLKLKRHNIFVNTEELKHVYRQMVKSIRKLPSQGELMVYLSEALEANGNTLPDVDQEFNSQLDVLRNHLAIEMQTVHEQLHLYTPKMATLIDDSHIPTESIAKNQELLLEKNGELQEQLNALTEWKDENIQDMTIVNFNFIPYMQWFQDSVHSFAKSQARKVVGEIRDVLIQTQFYTCGINQVGVSFLKTYGPEHIRQN